MDLTAVLCSLWEMPVQPSIPKTHKTNFKINFRSQSLQREQKCQGEQHGKGMQSFDVMIQPYVKRFTFFQGFFLSPSEHWSRYHNMCTCHKPDFLLKESSLHSSQNSSRHTFLRIALIYFPWIPLKTGSKVRSVGQSKEAYSSPSAYSYRTRTACEDMGRESPDMGRSWKGNSCRFYLYSAKSQQKLSWALFP